MLISDYLQGNETYIIFTYIISPTRIQRHPQKKHRSSPAPGTTTSIVGRLHLSTSTNRQHHSLLGICLQKGLNVITLPLVVAKTSNTTQIQNSGK